MSAPRIVVGVMTGTSIDGMDVAVARIDGRALQMQATLVGHRAHPLGDLSGPLRSAAEQRPMTARQFAELAWSFGRLHAEAIAATVASLEAPVRIDLVVAHGQTIYHRPPHSWQLLNPAPIAAALRCRVACDLRQADLAAGGEGAPITPLADWILFRHPAKARAIVNLGGFCNATLLPRGEGTAGDGAAGVGGIRGADLCACNLVLDAVARAALNCPFDADGAAAASGSPARDAVAALRHTLSTQRGVHRSLGTGDEAAAWVAALRADLQPADLAASAVAAVGGEIGDRIKAFGVDEAFVAGGGARHALLRRTIATHAGHAVGQLDELGVPVEAREALEMAVLGALAEDGVEITLPAATGRKESPCRAGVWTG